MQVKRKSQVPGILVALCLALAAQGAFAADDGYHNDKQFLVWARAFFASGDTAIKIDSQTTGLSGTLLDLEHDLGIDDSDTTPVLGVRWRFAKKHALDLGYFELNRSGNLIIDTQIRWDDLVFPIAADIDSFFDTRVIRLSYRYSLVSDPNKEFAIGGGIHWTEMEASISEVSVGSSKVESDAPLPMFTLAFDYGLSPKWWLQLSGEWFGIELGGIEGDIWHADAAVVWQTWEQVGFSLGYNLFKLDVGVGDADFRGLFDYTYEGPFLGAEFRF